MSKHTICICGGGNLAHVVGGYIASKDRYEVRLFTRHPERWKEDRTITVTDCNGKVFNAQFSIITKDPEKAVKGADIVLLCLPGFAIASTLQTIKPYLAQTALVGSVVSSTGFFLMARNILSDNTGLFGLQRVPFIARTKNYGKSAELLGYKSSLSFAVHNIKDTSCLEKTLNDLFDTPLILLDNYLKVTLTNSNPLLHPSRLYGMFSSQKESYDSPIRFYEDWDDFSSETLIACDNEFGKLLEKLDITRKDIPSILDYYESTDASSLTRKIKSIDAFKGLLAPMIQTSHGTYKPDFTNRYFTEDFPYGMLIIKCFAQINNISTPTIDSIIEWEQKCVCKEYIREGQTIGKDLKETIAPYIIDICKNGN